jgi:excisionase family DNA binding protein
VQVAQPVPPNQRLAISIAEAAALLGISRALAYELAARGELPTLRLGYRLVVPWAQLLALVGISGPASDTAR